MYLKVGMRVMNGKMACLEDTMIVNGQLCREFGLSQHDF